MTSLQELTFPPEYFCDEVRDGFFVSETTKRLWAAQMVILSEIDRICKKHDLNWYADSGTMLGTVRHKGFIPWDDDIDIAMFRDDYERFVEYAKAELSDDYKVRTSIEDDFEFPFARIINKGVFDLNPEHMARFHGCPFSVGVDIFPLDNIYDDEQKEEDRVRRGKLIHSTITGIVSKTMPEEIIKKNVDQIEKENNVYISTKDPLKGIKKAFEKLALEANNQDSKAVTVMIAWINGDGCKYTRSYYDQWIDMPYETSVMRVPTKYHEILKAYYGDYMTPIKGTALHEFQWYREIEDKFRARYGKNPTLRYHFDRENFKIKEKRKPYMEQQKELLKYMLGFHNEISKKVGVNALDEASSYLETCQNAAVTIGNSLEGKYGEGIDAVHALETYCEKVYEASMSWNDSSKTDLDDSLTKAEVEIENLFGSSKKEILFLLCKASWWDSISDIYNNTVGNEANNVHAIPIPYSYLDDTKNLMGWKTDLDEFKKIPELCGRIAEYDEYRPETRRPDVIVIQFPYDGFCGVMAIPQQLFTGSLLEYTDKLVFVPYLEPDPPESTKDITYIALQEYVEQPAVFNADKVMIGSEKLRKFVIQKLVDMTDESLKEYWNNRICLKENL